jgi:hypothetical protein
MLTSPAIPPDIFSNALHALDPGGPVRISEPGGVRHVRHGAEVWPSPHGGRTRSRPAPLAHQTTSADLTIWKASFRAAPRTFTPSGR